MARKKPKILVICAKGLNRSKYLASYLRRKGYPTKYGGIEPFEEPERKWNPISQKKIDWADIIIIVRKRLHKLLRKKFKAKYKKIIVLDITDSPRLIPKEFSNLKKKLDYKAFQKRWTYPQLRKAIKPYLPLKLK